MRTCEGPCPSSDPSEESPAMEMYLQKGLDLSEGGNTMLFNRNQMRTSTLRDGKGNRLNLDDRDGT